MAIMQEWHEGIEHVLKQKALSRPVKHTRKRTFRGGQKDKKAGNLQSNCKSNKQGKGGGLEKNILGRKLYNM